MIDSALAETFHCDGWCRLGRVIDDAMLDALRREEARFRHAEPVVANTTIFRSQLADHSKIVRAAIRAPDLVAIAQRLIGPNVAHWFNQFVTKFSDGGTSRSHFPWHQDNGYAAILPATNVTIWIALDDVDERNGCVWILPRSHLDGLRPHGRASGDSWLLAVAVEGDGVPAPLRAGEAVAFSGLTLHRSKTNDTAAPRRAFFIEYVDAAASYRVDDRPVKPVTMNPATAIVAGELPWSADRPRVI